MPSHFAFCLLGKVLAQRISFVFVVERAGSHERVLLTEEMMGFVIGDVPRVCKANSTRGAREKY